MSQGAIMARQTHVRRAAGALALLSATFLATGPGETQSANPPGRNSSAPAQPRSAGAANKFLSVPLVDIVPGGHSAEPKLTNPVADDPGSVERGMQYFNGFNCVGCHAPNGGGGMGPALTSRNFIFGNAPAQHFMIIAHGAPYGMPAWADLLPENVIWDLVSYIDSISDAPEDQWGTTVSARADLPRIQQAPAEFNPTARPWQVPQPPAGGKPSPK
jgi:cytochrome c oxidase cbb3-type subunit III